MGIETPKGQKSIDQILSDLNAQKELKTKTFKFFLVQDFGLDGGVEVELAMSGGNKVNFVTFKYKGLKVKFKITDKSIETIEILSYNDDNVSAIEEGMIAEYKQILIDYFSEHEDDRPE